MNVKKKVADAGPRVRLLHESDIAQMSTWGRHTDPLFVPYNVRPMTVREQRAFYRYWTAKRGVVSLAAVLGERFVGHVLLRTLDLPAHQADLGISLDPSIIGHGLGTQILRATLAYAAEHGITTVGLDVAAYNQRAISAYWNAGFREVGVRWMQYDSTIDFATLLSMQQYEWLREHVRYEDGYITKILRMST